MNAGSQRLKAGNNNKGISSYFQLTLKERLPNFDGHSFYERADERFLNCHVTTLSIGIPTLSVHHAKCNGHKCFRSVDMSFFNRHVTTFSRNHVV